MDQGKSSEVGKTMKIAIVGVTGAVGKELVSILQERRFPVTELVPFASSRSEGKLISVFGRSYPCQVLKPGCFDGVQIAFFDASDSVSEMWVPEAVRAGAWVIDNSATFRLNPDSLLVVPEVNGHRLTKRLRDGITESSLLSRVVSGPNCSTVQLVMALKPLDDRFKLRRVIVSSYQSTSGAGVAAQDELKSQTMDFLNGGRIEPRHFKHQIAFNCIPQIGSFGSDGFTSEERKIQEETRVILGLPDLRINATAVRVPTLNCHGEVVAAEFERPFGVDDARTALSSFPGVQVLDEPSTSVYPLALVEESAPFEAATGRDDVYVGRIRRDPSIESGLNFWIVSDNLRKGAALNAIQIGEIILSHTRT
jgi:aspartate-semialdehyde dehydrogenase